MREGGGGGGEGGGEQRGEVQLVRAPPAVWVGCKSCGATGFSGAASASGHLTP